MNHRFSTLALSVLLPVLAAFIWLSSSALPEVVASHFGVNGAANGFMPRGAYVAIMLALALGLPSLLAFLPGALAGQGGTNLNIPNREYWLAPERRENTVAFIVAHGRLFAVAVAFFLAYVHWLVVRANALRPPVLSTTGITAGLVVFFVFLAAWLFALLAKFRR
ncbi:DUF1648 domain-containing protein [Ideonella sp. B7]|uniref:DUF1648 domain-containing protein n=1 Tax=Ideonella benzenivorans TaxID=2831643 RepID=UPI001CEDE70B|nr:DUF1648 domain-containing protein [Ideonella benzenivorans]MCA6216029.1 DUF1648 domain-containing protein [Ideonella benzenivorans]